MILPTYPPTRPSNSKYKQIQGYVRWGCNVIKVARMLFTSVTKDGRRCPSDPSRCPSMKRIRLLVFPKQHYSKRSDAGKIR